MAAYPAEQRVVEETRYSVLSESAYFRTDFIMLENNLDLDTKKRDDRVQYIGIDYSFSLDIKGKSEGPELFFKVERNGPYDYDAPIIIHNTLQTDSGKIQAYHGSDLIPQASEFWADIPIGGGFFKFKPGLYPYSVGNGISLTGYFSNYGLMLYANNDAFKWNLYYCWPDYNNKNIGPQIKQEEEQGIDYYHSKSYFFATDMTFSIWKNTFQPYVGILLDRSGEKRKDLFTTPTHNDTLGTVGIAWNFALDKLAMGCEIARNFGGADSADGNFESVVHQGYAMCANLSYALGKLTPRGRFLYASGNKVTTDMITNGDTTFTSTKNNAFSSYSPFNANLADSMYPYKKDVPILAMGNGWGLNYGIQRPGTFSDPALADNIILFGAGFEYLITEKASLAFDWWNLESAEKGIGTYNGIPKVISPDLGNEADLVLTYTFNKSLNFSVTSAFFFPGAAYREERDDTGGSLFTPFVRGDGKADPAYQVEMSLELNF